MENINTCTLCTNISGDHATFSLHNGSTMNCLSSEVKKLLLMLDHSRQMSLHSGVYIIGT